MLYYRCMPAAPRMTEEAVHQNLMAEAIAEAEAHLTILKILAPLEPDAVRRVMRAVSAMMEADAAVPGVIDRFLAETTRARKNGK